MQILSILPYIDINMQNMQNYMQNMQNMQTRFQYAEYALPTLLMTYLVHTGTYRYIPVHDLLNATCMYVLVCTKYVLETLHVSLT